MSAFRTPLGRARGLGSAKDGVRRFIAERVSSVALVFLVAWGVCSALTLAGAGYDGAVEWIGAPLNAALMVLLAAVGFYHMRLGMAVVIEDYIAKPSSKAILLIANTMVCYGAMALTVICLLKVALTGGRA
jgi:succinate dehydrogenase / fumarate reductase, membrane anchor subunit